MPTGTIHIKNWLNRATPDYYLMFVKAWIPLNAWYVNEYDTKDDSKAIQSLKSGRNKIRNRIESLLINDDYDSKKFRHHIAQLHQELEERNLEHRNNKISFSHVKLESGVLDSSSTDTDRKGNVYIASVGTGFYEAKIVKDNGKGKTIMNKKFNEYDINKFLTEPQYVGLDDPKMQEKIRTCFQNINPNRTISLVSTSRKKDDKIILDSDTKLAFINNSELITKTVIQVIYYLRCALFHGEIDPTDTNQRIYKHAFYSLSLVIQELH